jgi:acyl carrier protein
MKPISFDDFSLFLARELDAPELRASPKADLVEEIGFDSLAIYELVLVVEELGVVLPEPDFDAITSVEHAYEIYVDACGST